MMKHIREILGVAFFAACLLVAAGNTVSAQDTIPAANASSAAGGKAAAQLSIAPLVEPGVRIASGDLLRTSRVFNNWNLNCEVLISQRRQVCAIEALSLDTVGRQIFGWSIATGTDGNPLMVFRMSRDVDQSYGLRMTIGSFGTVFRITPENCNEQECRLLVSFDATLRALVASQNTIGFSLTRENNVQQINIPLVGLAEAITALRQDPIGLVALTRQPAAHPAPARPAEKGKASSK